MASQKYHILKEYANGVMDEKGRFYPYKAWTSKNGDVTAKVGIRFYIKSICVTTQKAGALATQNLSVAITKNKQVQYIVAVDVPETFAASNTQGSTEVNCGILCDVNTSIDGTMSSYGNFTVIYAEIEEQEGEYSG